MTYFNMQDFQQMTSDPEEGLALEVESKYVRTSPKIIFLPCKLEFVKSVKGYIFLGFIVFVWAYSSYFVPTIVLLPQYNDGNLSVVPVLCYFFLSLCTIVSLFRAATTNPGRLPFDLRPAPIDALNWTHCQRCLIQRPLKSHHCSKCQRCVRKMDHHCYWINNCVAEDNQWIFLLLVLYATLLSLYTLLLDILHFYYFPACKLCDTTYIIFQIDRYLMYMSCALAVLLITLAGGQFLQQTLNILANRSTVESIIHSHKPIHERPFVMPRSAYSSFSDVCGPGPLLLWLNPFRKSSRKPEIFYYQQKV